MCGIAGEINISLGAKKNNSFLNNLCHRGPHNSSILKINKKICFYHTRLKIIDLSNLSNQPMTSKDKRYIISYNGELYNYLEIKKKLILKGYKFYTSGDTEVFLTGFIEYGIKFFEMINGIFAVSLFDKKKNLLYLARDFIGVKPLYYNHSENRLIFASELKAIVNQMSNIPKLNRGLLNEYLFYKYNSGSETLIKNIHKFSPGNVYIFHIGKKKIELNKKKFYKFKETTSNLSLFDTVENTKTLLNQSLSLQLQSDANLGIQLSGGIDSTLITHIACKKQKIRNLYFSTFKKFIKDEFEYANLVAKRLNINFKTVELNKKFFFKNFRKSIYFLDEPLNHPHSLAIYQIAKAAKKNISVILSGEGADEIFYGYERYKNINENSSADKLIRNGAFLRTNDDIRLYKLFSSNTYGDPHFERNKILNGINVEDNLTKFQLFETQTHLQSLLLRSDKMMMSSSIEARVPYLDKNLFNFSLNINKNIKKNNKQKIVLKKILSDLGYTKKFIERKKVGYIVPYNNWIKLKKNFKKDLNNEVLINLFNKENLDKLSVNLSKKKNIYSNAKFYWLLTNLNEYVKIFRINY